MTQDQQIASSHWSMFGADGFPIHKGSKGWRIRIELTSVFAPFGTHFPQMFPTKGAAEDFFNDLCMTKMREWRELDYKYMLASAGLEACETATRLEKLQKETL
jgi:hypothetical protein